MAEETENVKIIYVVAAPPTNLKNVYSPRPVYALAAIQLFCAVLTLVLGIVAENGIIFEIVIAIFFAIFGVFSLCGARTGSRCLIITTMVLSILSAFCGFITIFYNALHVNHQVKMCARLSEKFGHVQMDTPYFVNVNATRRDGSEYDASDEALCDPTNPETGPQLGMINGTYIGGDHPCFTLTCSSHLLATFSLLIVTSIIAMVAAITIGAFTCRVTCCYTPPRGATPKVVFNKEEEDEAEVGKYREL